MPGDHVSPPGVRSSPWSSSVDFFMPERASAPVGAAPARTPQHSGARKRRVRRRMGRRPPASASILDRARECPHTDGGQSYGAHSR